MKTSIRFKNFKYSSKSINKNLQLNSIVNKLFILLLNGPIPFPNCLGNQNTCKTSQ